MNFPYIGSGPYCYANAFAMLFGMRAPSTAVIEFATGSPFGMQLLGGTLPFFDPYGWNPERGFDAALDALGWTSDVTRAARPPHPFRGARRRQTGSGCGDLPGAGRPGRIGRHRKAAGKTHRRAAISAGRARLSSGGRGAAAACAHLCRVAGGAGGRALGRGGGAGREGWLRR